MKRATLIPSLHVRVACALAAVMVAVAFLTQSASGAPLPSVQLAPSTWTMIVLILVGAGLGIWGLVSAGLPRQPHWGTLSVVLFIALAALTTLSIAWSVAPDQSWLDAERTAAYLAIFAGAAVCARQLPGQWQALASAIAIATVALSGWALLVKIFDWNFALQQNYGRLTAPFGYWNATGVVAAMGLPATIWASARRRRSVILRGLAVPALTVLITVVVLSYSRSAVFAAVLGLAVPLLLSELRLRGLLKLVLGTIGAALISVWALTDRNLKADSGLGVPLLAHAARASADREFGVIVVVVVIVFTAVGIASARWADTVQLTVAVRRRLHLLLGLLLAAVPFMLLVALALSSRGIGGEVSHIWDSLTKESSGTSDSAARLTTLANSRPDYWHQAMSVFRGHPLAGSGADTFDPALLRYPTAHLTHGKPAGRAHSYIFQTLSDLGLIGGLLNLALLLCWGRAAWRSFAFKSWPGQLERAGQRPRLGLWGAEREGALGLLGVVVAFGASSAIDWTWFFPGVAMPAMAAAGWLAGRGPINQQALAAPNARRRRQPQASAFIAAAALAIVALVACWYAWQPLRAQNAVLASQNALRDADAASSPAAAGNFGAIALEDALNATHYQPASMAAWKKLSVVYSALGEPGLARAALVKATVEAPDNPVSWTQLGQYELCNGSPLSAVFTTLARAKTLNITRQPTGPKPVLMAAAGNTSEIRAYCGRG